MRVIGPSSADEVIALFLRADLDSKKIKAQTVRDALLSLGVGEEVLDPASHHATDASRPQALRKLLMMCHGNTVRELVLDEIDWSWAELQHDDPLFLMYYRDFWEWTHGTLLPRDAIEGFAQSRPLDSLTARIKSGESLPPCICLPWTRRIRLCCLTEMAVRLRSLVLAVTPSGSCSVSPPP